MKKLFAILLAAMMLLSFAACGKDNSNENKTTTAAPETTAPVTTTDAVTTAPTTNPTTTADSTLPEGGAVIEAGETEVFRGTVSDNIYMSAFSGLTFTADDKWTFMSEAELATLANITEEDITNDKLAATIKKNGAAYDMGASITTDEGILDAVVYVMFADVNDVSLKGKTLEESVELLAKDGFRLDLTNSENGAATYGGETYYKIDVKSEKAHNTVFGCQIGDVYVIVVGAASDESGVDLDTMFN